MKLKHIQYITMTNQIKYQISVQFLLRSGIRINTRLSFNKNLLLFESQATAHRQIIKFTKKFQSFHPPSTPIIIITYLFLLF